MIRLALCGNSGVGKDTCSKIILEQFFGLNHVVIRLADPLYAVQNYIYQICGKEKAPDAQDGVLLNFLGKHMRSINPDVLKDCFTKKIRSVQADLILCPDVRPLDIPYIQEAGFIILHIIADPSVALERRKLRGDISLGSHTHSTEVGLSPALYNHEIVNNGTIEEFKSNILSIVNGISL